MFFTTEIARGSAAFCLLDERIGDLVPMPRDGAIIFDDLAGKLDVLRVACDKCGRKGRYAVARLIGQRGRDAMVIYWCAEITADCLKKQAGNMSDQCAARCPDLPRVK